MINLLVCLFLQLWIDFFHFHFDLLFFSEYKVDSSRIVDEFILFLYNPHRYFLFIDFFTDCFICPTCLTYLILFNLICVRFGLFGSFLLAFSQLFNIRAFFIQYFCFVQSGCLFRFSTRFIIRILFSFWFA